MPVIQQIKMYPARVGKSFALYSSMVTLGLSLGVAGPTMLDLGILVQDEKNIAYILPGRAGGYAIGSVIGLSSFEYFTCIYCHIPHLERILEGSVSSNINLMLSRSLYFLERVHQELHSNFISLLVQFFFLINLNIRNATWYTFTYIRVIWILTSDVIFLDSVFIIMTFFDRRSTVQIHECPTHDELVYVTLIFIFLWIGYESNFGGTHLNVLSQWYLSWNDWSRQVHCYERLERDEILLLKMKLIFIDRFPIQEPTLFLIDILGKR